MSRKLKLNLIAIAFFLIATTVPVFIARNHNPAVRAKAKGCKLDFDRGRDNGFRQAIATLLGDYWAYPVTGITCHQVVDDLSIINRFKNLEELHLSKVSLSSLAGIEQLENLRILEIDLASTFDSDGGKWFEPISGLTELRELRMSKVSQSSLAGIEQLENLRILEIDLASTFDSNGGKWFEPISGLTELRELRIKGDDRHIFPLKTLQSLPCLRDCVVRIPLTATGMIPSQGLPKDIRTFHANSFEMTDLRIFAGLPQLERLVLYNAINLTSLDGLQQANNLDCLVISEAVQLKDIDAVLALRRLSVLGLSEAPVVVRSEGNMQGLVACRLGSAGAVSPRVFSGCEKLESLSVSNLESEAIESLGDLKSIEFIYLANCHATDFRWLGNMSNIEMIVIENSKINALGGMENLRQLCWLELIASDIQSLAPLKDLPNFLDFSLVVPFESQFITRVRVAKARYS